MPSRRVSISFSLNPFPHRQQFSIKFIFLTLLCFCLPISFIYFPFLLQSSEHSLNNVIFSSKENRDELHVVIARCKENLDWLPKMKKRLLHNVSTLRVFVYEKCGMFYGSSHTDTNTTSIANKGSEAFAYISHMVYHYDLYERRLVKYTFFLQGGPHNRDPDIDQMFLNVKNSLPTFSSEGDWHTYMQFDRSGCPLACWIREDRFVAMYRYLFGLSYAEEVPSHFGVWCCGEFLTHTEPLLRRGKAFWKRAYELMNSNPVNIDRYADIPQQYVRGDCGIEGHWMERMWGAVLGSLVWKNDTMFYHEPLFPPYPISKCQIQIIYCKNRKLAEESFLYYEDAAHNIEQVCLARSDTINRECDGGAVESVYHRELYGGRVRRVIPECILLTNNSGALNEITRDHMSSSKDISSCMDFKLPSHADIYDVVVVTWQGNSHHRRKIVSPYLNDDRQLDRKLSMAKRLVKFRLDSCDRGGFFAPRCSIAVSTCRRIKYFTRLVTTDVFQREISAYDETACLSGAKKIYEEICGNNGPNEWIISTWLPTLTMSIFPIHAEPFKLEHAVIVASCPQKDCKADTCELYQKSLIRTDGDILPYQLYPISNSKNYLDAPTLCLPHQPLMMSENFNGVKFNNWYCCTEGVRLLSSKISNIVFYDLVQTFYKTWNADKLNLLKRPIDSINISNDCNILCSRYSSTIANHDVCCKSACEKDVKSKECLKRATDSTDILICFAPVHKATNRKSVIFTITNAGYAEFATNMMCSATKNMASTCGLCAYAIGTISFELLKRSGVCVLIVPDISYLVGFQPYKMTTQEGLNLSSDNLRPKPEVSYDRHILLRELVGRGILMECDFLFMDADAFILSDPREGIQPGTHLQFSSQAFFGHPNGCSEINPGVHSASSSIETLAFYDYFLTNMQHYLKCTSQGGGDMCQLHFTMKSFLSTRPFQISGIIGANGFFYDSNGNLVKTDIVLKIGLLDPVLYPSGCMYFHSTSKEIWCVLARRSHRTVPAVVHMTCIPHESKLKQCRDSGGWYLDNNNKCLLTPPASFKCSVEA